MNLPPQLAHLPRATAVDGVLNATFLRPSPRVRTRSIAGTLRLYVEACTVDHEDESPGSWF